METMPPNSSTTGDPWSEWLLHRRHGGDPNFEKVVCDLVKIIRDRVLNGAGLKPGMVLVDVGTGDGLIPFGAFDRAGPTLRAIFTDVSARLLERAEERAVELGLRDRCEFLHTPAEQLEGVANESADIVTSRAVLAYVADKTKAFRQFHRVLKPGGRISIGEPINRDAALHLAAVTRYLMNQPNDEKNLPARLYQRWRAAQCPSTKEEIMSNPLTNFTERDLFNFCRLAGFNEIHLELHIDERKSSIGSWETYMNVAPLPNTRTFREILSADFTPKEQRLLEGKIRPLFESNMFLERDTVAYLTAIKPTQVSDTPSPYGSKAP